MTIREAINILIDAHDKDKPFIIECRKDALKNCDYEWGQLEITRIVNCPTLSVAEADNENERRKCMECKHFMRGKDGLRDGIIGRCKLRVIVGVKRLGSATACILFEEGAEADEDIEDIHQRPDYRT